MIRFFLTHYHSEQSSFSTPLGPIIPTIPAGGSLKFKSSYNNLSPKDLLTPSASITLFPNLGPGGIYNSSFSSFSFDFSDNKFS